MASDDPARFVTALSHAVHSASGRIDHRRRSGIQKLTDVLSEIAQRGAQTVIIIDDAERLPDATLRGPVQYLLLNAPANLSWRFLRAWRCRCRSPQLAAKGNLARWLRRICVCASRSPSRSWKRASARR